MTIPILKISHCSSSMSASRIRLPVLRDTNRRASAGLQEQSAARSSFFKFVSVKFITRNGNSICLCILGLPLPLSRFQSLYN